MEKFIDVLYGVIVEKVRKEEYNPKYISCGDVAIEINTLYMNNPPIDEFRTGLEELRASGRIYFQGNIDLWTCIGLPE